MQTQKETALAGLLRQRLLAGEIISLGQFMGLALGDPTHGYYMKQDPFGAEGDFTTAPEISQIFGEMIGLWLANFWQENHSHTDKIHLVECGPGRGTLMADLLRACAIVPGLRERLQIHLVEMSPTLRQHQQKTLSKEIEKFGNISWHRHLETVPRNAPLFLIGNEFFDALPIEQFIKKTSGWYKQCLSLDEDACFCFKPTLAATEIEIDSFPAVADQADIGDIIEISDASREFYTEVAKRLEEQTGCALFLDYGPKKSALGDSFQALHKHHYVTPLEHIGDADLTAHVDFEQLLKTLPAEMLYQYGPIEMGTFLQNIGFRARAEQLKLTATKTQIKDIDLATHRLLAPDHMGRLFKVIIATDKQAQLPAGLCPNDLFKER